MTSGVATSRLTTVVLATIVALLLTALVLNWGGQQQDRPTSATALLTTGRTGLQVCVESLGADLAPQAIRERVQESLTRVGQHPDFVPAGLGRRPVEVHQGCQAVPSIDQPGHRSSSRLGSPVEVTEASPFRLMVFVLAPSRMATAFDQRDPVVNAQEVMCETGRCPVVTSAAYFTPATLADTELLDDTLTEGVGLRRLDQPTSPQGEGGR